MPPRLKRFYGAHRKLHCRDEFLLPAILFEATLICCTTVTILAESPFDDAQSHVQTAIDPQWEFQPLRSERAPVVHDETWCRTEVDRFIMAKLEQKGIKPNPPVDRRTFIRRACFDLVGLPPAPDEVERFLNDSSPNAHELLIDRLLESPHYGERWGRHWLDLARFAESHGYEQDYDRPTAYHYRDFVIKALNQDMPY